MNIKTILVAPAMIASALLAGGGPASAATLTPTSTQASPTSTPMSISDGVLIGYDSSRSSDGKFSAGSATWTRSSNQLVTSLHVSTPYIFVAARGTVTATIYGDTPLGKIPLWSVSHDLTACAKADFTCSSDPSETWTDYPNYWDAQRIQMYGSSMEVTASVR
ncbi:hypothetical protein ACFRAU_14480 [Arthrobacter sp. NPDC056691]|uniref:hypothetical protein n=1 Tax=Arthrobacter sp. NPDC056691 TaxID=3345913 RepID=UPI003670371D